MRSLIIASLGLLFLGGFSSYARIDSSRVTLLRLLANPAQFDGKEVQVIGYLHLEFEGDGLYLHKVDYDNGILGNMVWIDVTSDMQKNIKQINDKYVIIRGVYDAKNTGHMGVFSGTLTKISRCDIWSDPNKPRNGKQTPNQRVDPTVKTPAESGNEQSTAGHT